MDFLTNNGESDIIFNGNAASGSSGITQKIRAVAIGGGGSPETTMYFETGLTGTYRFSIADGGGTQQLSTKIDVNGLSTTNLSLTSATTATSATAGAATALPATPTGYVEVNVNGTTVKVPYYTV